MSMPSSDICRERLQIVELMCRGQYQSTVLYLIGTCKSEKGQLIRKIGINRKMGYYQYVSIYFEEISNGPEIKSSETSETRDLLHSSFVILNMSTYPEIPEVVGIEIK